MAHYRPFAITPDPNIEIPGTTKIGSIVIGVDDVDYFNNYGELNWIAGPDEDLGIIIAYHDITIPLHYNSLTPGDLYSIGFLRAANNTDFVTLAESLVTFSPSTPQQAKIALNAAGYWTSFEEPFWEFGTI